PVVFLADCNRGSNNSEAHSTLVDWPADTPRPERLQLLPSKPNTDKLTQKIQDKKATAQAREQLNLLYVALTRAREYLFISGVATKKKPSGWYQLAHNAISSIADEQDDGSLHYIFGEHQPEKIAIRKEPEEKRAPLESVPELQQPIKTLARPEYMIAPSRARHDGAVAFISQHDPDAEDGKIRGIIIHRALELLNIKKNLPQADIHQILLSEFSLEASTNELNECFEEALSTVNNPQFAIIFSPQEPAECLDELPVLYSENGQSTYGLIDRLVIHGNEILLIDYKSHSQADADSCEAMATAFAEQMRLYTQGAQKIWPDHRIKKGILFTSSQRLVWLDE
ncbi:MAG: PD-(D/E)XK nuclease family protein, partial [Gammaproteobacteria bacterium]|nr:PD-(D/E)XK nuclease family protein [Gammaproteobacteria bacterium]